MKWVLRRPRFTQNSSGHYARHRNVPILLLAALVFILASSPLPFSQSLEEAHSLSFSGVCVCVCTCVGGGMWFRLK